MVSSGLSLLHELDSISCSLKVVGSIGRLLDLLPTSKFKGYEYICTGIERIINNTIDEYILSSSIPSTNQSLDNNIIHQLNEQLRKGLSYQYQSSWGFILTLFICFISKLNEHYGELVTSSILSVEEFAKDNHQKYQPVALEVISKAVEVIGVDKVLKILPLNLHEPITSLDRREWLIPVLKQSISGSTLHYFSTSIIPLTNLLSNQIKTAEKENDFVLAKNIKIILHQIWELFPSFCIFPKDIHENFNKIAKVLGKILSEDAILRIVVCQGLINLIQLNYQIIHPDVHFNLHKFGQSHQYHTISTSTTPNVSKKQAQENLKSLSSFSKNYLPILFNIYCTSKEEDLSELNKLNNQDRSIIYSTIHSFIIISDKPVIDSFFSSLLKKNLEIKSSDKADVTNKAFLTELSQAFVDSIDKNQLDFLFKVVKPQLSVRFFFLPAPFVNYLSNVLLSCF